MVRIPTPLNHNFTDERFKRASDGRGSFPDEPLPKGLVVLRVAMFAVSAVGMLVLFSFLF